MRTAELGIAPTAQTGATNLADPTSFAAEAGSLGLPLRLRVMRALQGPMFNIEVVR